MSKNKGRDGASSGQTAEPAETQAAGEGAPAPSEDAPAVSRAALAHAVRESLELSDKAAAMLLAYVELRDGAVPEDLEAEGRKLRQHPMAWAQLRNGNYLGFRFALEHAGLPVVAGPALQAAMSSVLDPEPPPAPKG